MIKIQNLNITYKDTEILKDASLIISPGDVVLLEGKNGTGKSTLLKTMLGLDKIGRKASGEINLNNCSNVLNMNNTELQKLRSSVAYLEQKDSYDAWVGQSVADVLYDEYAAYLNKEKLSISEKSFVEEEFSSSMLSEMNIKFKQKVSKLSGGQQRMLSIFASLWFRKGAPIFIIDEPLNNLDMKNVIHVSNMLNRIVRENKKAAFIIVSHCKIFPFINRVIELKDKTFVESAAVTCHACFGEYDEEGYYI